MYNGIGLDTARGSGTNGFVTKNLSFIRKQKERVDYEALQKASNEFNIFKKANPEILLHNAKRQVELKCLEMQELMEEEGYPASEIEAKVAKYREMLIQKGTKSLEEMIETDEQGRISVKDSHVSKVLNDKKNEQMRLALGIKETFKDGVLEDRERKKEEQANIEAATKDFGIVEEDEKEKKPKKKHHHRHHHHHHHRSSKKSESSEKKPTRKRDESSESEHSDPSPKRKSRSPVSKRRRRSSSSSVEVQKRSKITSARKIRSEIGQITRRRRRSSSSSSD